VCRMSGLCFISLRYVTLNLYECPSHRVVTIILPVSQLSSELVQRYVYFVMHLAALILHNVKFNVRPSVAP
jgi:hypothetical protein